MKKRIIPIMSFIILLISTLGLSACAKKSDYVIISPQNNMIGDDGSVGLAEIWQEIKETEIKLVKEIKKGNLDKIHNYSSTIKKLSGSLLESTSGLSDWQMDNVKSAIEQISETSDRFHEYGDQGDLVNTIKEGRKIRKLLKLLEAQFPKNVFVKTIG